MLLKLTFSFILSEILLEFILDFNNGLVHLFLLLGLIVSQLGLDFVELVSKLLAFETARIQASSKQLVLLGLILLHHIFHALHLVLQLVNHAADFFAGGSLFFEHVLQVSASLEGASDLLLKYGVLL